ncbi:hypothetical protein HDU93_006934, partial [Gonapodya sp. JEL0774]
MSRKYVLQGLALLDKKSAEQRPVETIKAKDGSKPRSAQKSIHSEAPPSLSRHSGGVRKLKQKALRRERQKLEEKKRLQEFRAIE